MNSQLHEQSAKMASGTQGKVYVVGAGPGRADLLTLRAHELLGQADVVLFDRLVSEDVLDRVRRDADRVYVGKRAGQHHRSQDEIHRLLVEHAKAGRTVVRLKGGDPFIFGRGGEEIEVLAKAGIDYEVVPGITAAAGCAAYGGIPLTHRDHAKVLSLVTGHLVSGEVDWAGIAGEGKTVAIYMGLKQAKVIRQALLDAGIRADMPVALISDGTRRTQQTFQGTVNGLSELAEQANPVAPALLIVGQVAEFASNLAWFQEIRQFSNAA